MSIPNVWVTFHDACHVACHVTKSPRLSLRLAYRAGQRSYVKLLRGRREEPGNEARSDKVGQSSRAAIFADSAGQNAYILSLILFATYFLVEVEFVSLN